MKFWVMKAGNVYVSHFLYHAVPSTTVKEIHYVSQLTRALRYREEKIGAEHLPRVNAFSIQEHELIEITPSSEQVVKLAEKLREEIGDTEGEAPNSESRKKALGIARSLLDIIDFFTKEYTQL